MTDPKPAGERNEQQEQEKWYERTWYPVLLFTAGFILYGLSLWMLLNLYFDPQTPAQKQSVVQTLVVFMGGALFLFGFSFIARYLQVPHSGVIAVTFLVVVFVLWVLVQPETANQRISFLQTVGGIVGGSALLFGLYFTAQTLQVNREGQITERFTRAIDQLGATDETTGKPRLEVRLGGIYALERIANDSPDRDYSSIMEVLTAYVRENAPRPLKQISSPGSEPSEPKPTASEPTSQGPPLPLADIQAILTILGRRKKAGQKGDVVLDLSMTDLRGARLEGAHLERAVLQRADLDRARLERAHLEGADLRGANLKGAHIEEAHVEGTDLRPYVTWGDTDKTIYDVAHLTIAEASEVGLTQGQLDQTIGNEHTKLPPDLKPPAHWNVKTDQQIEEP